MVIFRCWVAVADLQWSLVIGTAQRAEIINLDAIRHAGNAAHRSQMMLVATIVPPHIDKTPSSFHRRSYLHFDASASFQHTSGLPSSVMFRGDG